MDHKRGTGHLPSVKLPQSLLKFAKVSKNLFLKTGKFYGCSQLIFSAVGKLCRNLSWFGDARVYH